jgi:hypothetical protein
VIKPQSPGSDGTGVDPRRSHIVKGNARFSDCGKYSYRLWRTWDETRSRSSTYC